MYVQYKNNNQIMLSTTPKGAKKEERERGRTRSTRGRGFSILVGV
jgi:hypothetical protein